MQRQIELGLLDASVSPHRLVDTTGWDELSEGEQRISAREMEIYAAMIDRTVQPLDGLSWSELLERGVRVYPEDRAVGSELFGSRSLRRGDWKITDLGDGRWRLFNIDVDPGETRDFSAEEPERKTGLVEAWSDYAQDVGVVLPDPPLHPNSPREWE